MPRTVTIRSGWRGFRSILCRRFETCTSQRWSSARSVAPESRARISRRVTMRPGSSLSRSSSLNCEAVRWTERSSTTSWRKPMSRRRPPISRTGPRSAARPQPPRRGRGAPAADQPDERARLRDAVVGAELEREHAVALAVARAQRDPRDRADAAKLAQHVEAGELAQVEVEQDQVDRPSKRGVERGLAVCDPGDLEAFAAEAVRDRLPRLLRRVGEQNRRAHTPNLPRAATIYTCSGAGSESRGSCRGWASGR